MIARHHARAIAQVEGGRVAAVASRSEARAKEMAAEIGCRAYGDLAEMLEDPAVQVVSICTPSGAHMEPAIAAAEAGRHLIIEKPLEISLERCDRIIEAAERHGVQLGGVFQSRFFEASRLLKAAVEAGRFGDMVLADAYVKWFRPQEYYDHGGWKGTAAFDGGGALMNQSIHAIDLLLWCAGPVRSVQAFKGVRGHRRIEVEDTAVAALEFESGAMGVLEGSTAVYPGFLKRIELSGTGGSAVLEEEDLKTWSFSREAREDEEIRRRFSAETATGGGASDPGAIGIEGHRRQFEDFLGALDAGRPLELDGREARRAVELVLAVYRSAENGERVRLSR
jgi:predicted dehydrogenase